MPLGAPTLDLSSLCCEVRKLDRPSEQFGIQIDANVVPFEGHRKIGIVTHRANP